MQEITTHYIDGTFVESHGRHVAELMTRALSREQLVQLRDLCHAVKP